MPDLRDLAMETEPATVLNAIVESFRNRLSQQQPPTADDLQFLEKAVQFYGELCIKEAAESAKS